MPQIEETIIAAEVLEEELVKFYRQESGRPVLYVASRANWAETKDSLIKGLNAKVKS